MLYTVDATDEGRARLGRAVKRRREFLRLSIDAAAALGPMSPVTWSNIEKGIRARGLSYAGIEHVLGWAADSVERILDGGEPLELQAQPSGRQLPAGFNLLDEYGRIRELKVSCETKLALLGEIIEMYERERTDAQKGNQDRTA